MFNLESLAPGGKTLINSGLPLFCPLCKTCNLKAYKTGFFIYEILICNKCGFFGNPINLYSQKSGESYSESLIEYEESTSQELKDGEKYFSNQMKLHNILNRRESNPGAVNNLLFTHNLNINSSINKPLLRSIKLVDSESIQDINTLIGSELEAEDSLIIPFYVKYPIMSSLNVIRGRSTEIETAYIPNGKYVEGGILDFSTEDDEKVLMVGDIREGLQLLQSFTMRSPSRGAPICFYHPDSSYFTFDMESRDYIIHTSEEKLTGTLPFFKINKGARFLTSSLDNLQKTISKKGPKTMESLYADAHDLYNIFYTVEPSNEIINFVVRLISNDEELSRIIMDMPDKYKGKFLEAAGINPEAEKMHIDDTHSYLRFKNGSIERVSRSQTNNVVTLAECSLDFKKIIHLEDDTIYRVSFVSPKVRIEDIDIPEELVTDKDLEIRIHDICRKEGLEPYHTTRSNKTWFYLCMKLSEPEVCKMYRKPTKDLTKVYLPGRTVHDNAYVEEKNFIYPEVRVKKGNVSQCEEHMNGIQFGIILGLLSEFLPLMMGNQSDIIIPRSRLHSGKSILDKFIKESPLLVKDEDHQFASRVTTPSDLEFIMELCFCPNPYIVNFSLTDDKYKNLKSLANNYLNFIIAKWMSEYSCSEMRLSDIMDLINEEMQRIIGSEGFQGFEDNNIISKEYLSRKERRVLPVIASQTFTKNSIGAETDKDNDTMVKLRDYQESVAYYTPVKWSTRKEFVADLQDHNMDVHTRNFMCIPKRDWDQGFKRLKALKELVII